jgi:two-component system chemotaxis response regulator CheY
MNDQTRTLVIVDDEPHIRAFLRSLALEVPAQVLGEGCNGKEACSLFREKKPDAIILDLNMPIMSGEEAMLEILGEFPDAKVIVLSAVADRDLVQRCLGAGAASFILKDSPIDVILDMIGDVFKT